jgi:membrane protein
MAASNGSRSRPPEDTRRTLTLQAAGGLAAVLGLTFLRPERRPAELRPSGRPGRAMGDDRGRLAGKPTQIPKRGWRDVLARVKAEVSEDQVSSLAGGVAFFAFLALIPAMAAMTSIYGLVSDPNDVATQLDWLTDPLPQAAGQFFREQFETIAGAEGGGLSLGLAVSLVTLLWSASAGMQALMRAVGRAYDEAERRSPVKLRLTALGLTLGALVLAAASLGAIVVLPAVMDDLGLGTIGQWVISALRWPALGVLIALGLAILYRVSPDRDDPKWRWATPGAFVAIVLWLMASIGFSVYAGNFGSYNETYGALSAIIILLLWLYISAYAVLVGAELNAEMEHQTAVDTTVGPDRPMGQRGATMADELGITADEVKAQKHATKAGA